MFNDNCIPCGRTVDRRSEVSENKPVGKQQYLVTSDLSVLVKRWAKSKGLHVPGRRFFAGIHGDLETELRRIFSERDVEVVFLPWITMKTRLMQLIDEQSRGLPVISLDPVFVENADTRPQLIHLFLRLGSSARLHVFV